MDRWLCPSKHDPVVNGPVFGGKLLWSDVHSVNWIATLMVNNHEPMCH